MPFVSASLLYGKPRSLPIWYFPLFFVIKNILFCGFFMINCILKNIKLHRFSEKKKCMKKQRYLRENQDGGQSRTYKLSSIKSSTWSYFVLKFPSFIISIVNPKLARLDICANSKGFCSKEVIFANVVRLCEITLAF